MKPRHSSIVGLATLALAGTAVADVYYSNFQNITIPANYAGVYLDVQTGASNTNMFSPVSGWDINPYFGGSTLANSPGFQPVRSGTGSLDAVVNLSFGSTVGSGSTYSTFVQGPGGQNPGQPGYGGSETHVGGGVGQFVSGSEGYLGFRLNNTDYDYGYMRVVLTNNSGGAVIKDWAYDTSGASVVVGGIRQVGQDVTLSSGFTLASAVINSGGTTNLVKTGAGTNTLSATSTYTGSTTVNAGTLLVNGALAGTTGTSVASGATLGGTGSIANSVTVASGGFLSPGTASSIESLGLGSLDLQGTLLIEWDTTVSPNIDFLDIAGTLNLGSNSSITFTNLGAGSLDLNTPYIFAQYGPGGLTGTFNTVNLLPSGFTIDYNYGGLNQIAIVPEPSTLVMTLLLSLPVVLRRRRGA